MRTGAFSGKKSFYLKNPKLERRVYSTGDSQVVTHQGTTPAQHCLTSVIRCELVLLVWYGRRHLDMRWKSNFKSMAQL